MKDSNSLEVRSVSRMMRIMRRKSIVYVTYIIDFLRIMHETERSLYSEQRSLSLLISQRLLSSIVISKIQRHKHRD